MCRAKTPRPAIVFHRKQAKPVPQNGVTHIAAMADGDVPALAGTHTRKGGGGLFKGLQHQGGGRLENVKEIIGYRKSLSGDDPDRQNGKSFIL